MDPSAGKGIVEQVGEPAKECGACLLCRNETGMPNILAPWLGRVVKRMCPYRQTCENGYSRKTLESRP
jgi:hypothetical protein